MHAPIKLIVAFLLCCTTYIAFSQQEYSVTDLRSDFTVFRSTLEKKHAGLYRYQSKSYMDKIFDSCYLTIKDSMTLIDFYTLTSFVIGCVEDGHTNCKLPRDFINKFVTTTPVFPAMVFFIHNRAFILCSNRDSSLRESELLAIDGQPMNEIISRLFMYIQSDAGIASHKNWELPENFQVLYYALFGAKDSFQITCKKKSGDIVFEKLQADVITNIICAHPFTRPDKFLLLNYHPGGIAVLTIKTFFESFLEQTKENFKSFLDSAFIDIKKKGVDKLLIDIRSNQGGNDANGEILYSYLNNKPFQYYLSQETNFEKFSDSDHPNLKLQQPMTSNYKGKVFVLANGRSFSASAEFSAIVKSNGRGLFIGEECGGGYYGNTSGDEENLVLPITKLNVRVPMVKYTSAVKQMPSGENGIIPDYIYYNTITDLAEGKDSQFDFAIKIIVQ